MNTPPPSANIAPGPVWALLSPIGRLSREPYWLSFAFVLVIIGIPVKIWLSSLMEFQANENLTLETLPINDFMASNPLLPILYLVLNWVHLALVIKRLQDVGLSGFLALLIFVPVVSLLLVIILGFVPSQAKPNRSGPLPNSYWRKS
ncbi:DUF805 domain-containing protein [Roseibium album]|uniref:Putative membrane protein n=1 Tax=Roseibium album TaxID=311410 RepID=A0A0M7AXH2_9HYPH|nr:DUF805 domain-containing protein [Roseibium album]CTQ62023.1 putative membrane protein [Roseibium album]CTQ78364.1 putative membrane protein [Roseibium album]CTQ79788.1 putative membrane protein [Roseibium album]